MSKNKIKVGMNVYTIPVGFNNTRPIKDDIEKHIKEEKVSKVGRKYFYLEGGDEKYNLDNLKYDSDYHYDMQAF